MPTPETNLNQQSSSCIFAADLGGTNLRAATIDLAGTISSRVRHPSPGNAENPEDVVRALVAAALECERQTVSAGGVIHGASIAVPGIVDTGNALVIRAPNVPSLDNFQLKEALQRELDWPVVLENDANAAAVGEMWMGAGRGCRSIICLTLGTGVGGGIILDGQLWRGADGFAGEIGHMTVDPFNSPKCNCGNQGCLEMFASATGVVRLTHEALSQFPDSSLAGTEVTATKVFEAGLVGDKLALAVFSAMGTYLGIGLASLINLLNPEMIVIGGGVANAWQLFEKDMREQVAQRAFPLPAARVRIVPAECGDDAGLLGAARLAFDL
jgi:glucokinase